MMNEEAILDHVVGLHRETLIVWIERGWVIPERSQDAYWFQEIDIARVLLIQEFSTDLNLNEDAMDVILPLLDQMHGLRRQLKHVVQAINTQPENIRQNISEYLGKQ